MLDEKKANSEEIHRRLKALTPEKRQEALMAAHEAVAKVLGLKDDDNLKVSDLVFELSDKKVPDFFSGPVGCVHCGNVCCGMGMNGHDFD